MFLFISGELFSVEKFCDLNTSHVLIYLKENVKDVKEFAFKYISCSYLSKFL